IAETVIGVGKNLRRSIVEQSCRNGGLRARARVSRIQIIGRAEIRGLSGIIVPNAAFQRFGFTLDDSRRIHSGWALMQPMIDVRLAPIPGAFGVGLFTPIKSIPRVDEQVKGGKTVRNLRVRQ